MWKSHASEKLGVIDTRERAAIEYRESLKQRWKHDPEVGRITRYLFSACVTVRFYLTPVAVGLDIFRGPCTRHRNSSAPCSTRGKSRRSVGGSTLVQETASRRPSGRLWSLQNKLEYSLYRSLVFHCRFCYMTPTAHIWISHQLCGVHHCSLHLGFRHRPAFTVGLVSKALKLTFSFTCIC